MKRISLILICLCSFLNGAPPPVPSAGVVERELQKEYEANPLERNKEIPDLQIDIPEERLDIPEGLSVSISRVHFEGNEALPANQLESIAAPYLGRSLTIKDIYAMCHEVDQAYAKAGYFLARAYPPPQEIEGGTLLIRIIEGRLGAIRIEGAKYYPERFIKSFFEGLQGCALCYDAFMRSILLLNETSDLQAAAVFVKGEEPETADIVIQVKDRRPLHLYSNANNYGQDLTTNYRAGGRLDWGSLLFYGDTLSVAGVVGFPIDALYFTNMNYRIPLNRNGTFLEFAYLFSKFKIEEMRALQLRSATNVGTVKATHALIRSRSHSLDLFGSFDYKQIKNFSLNQVASFDKLRIVSLGGVYDRFSSRGTRDYLAFRCETGIPNFLGGLHSVDSLCSRAGGGGLFFKVNADYDHLQSVYSDWMLSLHLSGQWSPYKLASPEQIYLGGSDTVRGYPLAVVLGDSGYYVKGEFRFPPLFLANCRFFMAKRPLREVLQLVTFFDTGGAHLNGGSNTFLSGTGVGLRYQGPLSLSLSFDVGFPLSHAKWIDGPAMYYLKVTGQLF
jgi:hemolysin activation/secretion protein